MTYIRPSIIVDIDGTIANCEHRLHHIENFSSDTEATFEADWDAFYSNCDLDDPIGPVVQLVKSLCDRDYCVILITGRSGKYREQTEQWLRAHEIPFDLLLMRKDGDHTSDDVIKRAWWRLIKSGQVSLPEAALPNLVIEDRKRVVEMWREEGLICLQCAKGDF